MINNRSSIILIVLAAVLVIIYSSVFVVNERQQAIVVRFGEIRAVKTEPGLYFKLPFAFMDADRVQYVEDQALRFDLDNIACRSPAASSTRLMPSWSTGSRTPVASAKRSRAIASRPKRAFARVSMLRFAASTASGAFEAALSDERASMMREVRTDLRADAESLGLNIEDVRIRRTDLTQEVSQQTFDRMKAERLAEAELIRARGNEEGQRRRAIADRQVVEIIAEAQRDSEILRGEGEAERTGIFCRRLHA